MKLHATTAYGRKFLADEVGATLAEYAVVAAIICGAMVVVATALGSQISQMFSNVGQDF